MRLLQGCCVDAITSRVNVLVISTFGGFEPESKADPDPQVEPEWSMDLPFMVHLWLVVTTPAHGADAIFLEALSSPPWRVGIRLTSDQ